MDQTPDLLLLKRGCRGRDRMVGGFTTTYAISLSPLTLWVWIPLMARCAWYNILWWRLKFVSFSTNKIDHHDITEILLKVLLNAITSDTAIEVSKNNHNTSAVIIKEKTLFYIFYTLNSYYLCMFFYRSCIA